MVPDLADTIVAIGTAPGGAARGVIRISGPEAIAVVARCFHATSVDLATIVSPQVVIGELAPGDGIQALPCDLFLWPDEHSYTRQPSAELHTLGSPPLLELAIANLCRNGARLAEPGEFTLRAFLAGRLDLTQAEAVLGVIDATTDSALQTALGQLAGGLSQPLSILREQLLQLLAELEAGLDFVEEDIEFISRADIERQLTAAQTQVAATLSQLQSRSQTQVLPKVVLAGEPNAGKSSLFNAIVERYPLTEDQSLSMVSARAGTTRDYLSATVSLNGIACELIDTAGIDFSDTHGIPGQAQEMTSGQLHQADCTIWCVDITSPTATTQLTGAASSESELTVATKVDLLPINARPTEMMSCSSHSGIGIAELSTAIADVIRLNENPGAVATTAARCRDGLVRAQESLQLALALVDQDRGDELIAAEIRSTLGELGRVVGAVYTDDILDRIFSQFCIGK